MNQIISYYNQLAKYYDESRFNNSYGQFIDQQERSILNQLLKDNNGVVLDLACGSGRFLNYAEYGIDASHEMVKIAKKKYPHKQITVSDAEKLPFEDNSIDTIIAFHFFMHLTQNTVETILNECNRVLKKDGKIIFDIPSKKRRQILKYKAHSWHGSLSFTVDDIKHLNQSFLITRTFGIMFFPIHRFPKRLRNFVLKFDYVLGNFFKEYCSYLIFEYQKR